MKTRQLSVIHLSTGHEGGAGLAARRLNDSLVAIGVDSKFVAIKRSGYSPQINEEELHRNLLRKFLSRIVLKVQQNFSRRILFSTISSNAAPLTYFARKGNEANTVLHFHNWANLISERSLLELSKCGFKIVLTAHDQRITTGGCHYSFSCQEFRGNCRKCPLVKGPMTQVLVSSKMKKKRELMESSRSVPVVIGPSKWMVDQLRQSKLFPTDAIYHIQNTLGPHWNPTNYHYRYHPERERITVGIASKYINSYVKAGDVLSVIIQSKPSYVDFIFLAEIPETDHFPKFWEKIDILLALTRADNSPNVIWEAKSLSIPIVSNRIGGVTEILGDHPSFLLEKVEDAIPLFSNSNESFFRELLQKASPAPLITAHLDCDEVALQHLNLYKKVLNNTFAGDSK